MGERFEGESLWAWGLRLERDGDVQGALGAYSQAVDAGEEPPGPRAVLRCAEQLESRGDHRAAEEAFRRATDAPEPDVEAAAWRGLANYMMGRGEYAEGMAALEAIVATGDPDESARALRNIGTFKEDALGDVEGAKAAYEASIALDHPMHSQGARVNLAQLLEKQGDVAGAGSLFRAVIESGHPVESGRARTLLGWMLESQGDAEGALALFMQGVEEEPTSEWGQRAAFGAGTIFSNRGELDRALDAFGLAERIDDPEMAAVAACMLAETARQLGQEETALDAYLRAARAPGASPTVAAAAAKEAGMILVERREVAAARDLFALAADAGDGEAGARAALLMAICERQLGNRPAAMAAAERAVATPGAPPDVVESASRLLAELR